MSYCKRVFCEDQFLKKMCQEASEESPARYETKKVWKSLYHFLKDDTVDFHIDFSSENWYENYKATNKVRTKAGKEGKPLPLYENLIVKMEESAYDEQDSMQLHFGYKGLTSETTDLDSNAIYLTMLGCKQCEKLSKQSGCLILCPDNIQQFVPLTNDNGLSIEKDKFEGNWQTVFEICELPKWKRYIPCNFITIVDNYLLNKTELINENLTPILDALLPKFSVIMPFPIKIISRFRNSGTSGTDLDFDCRWNLVKDIVISLKRPYDISLCLIKCGDTSFHDRTILTDNLWISSGAGFDLFKNKRPQNSTLISIVSPFLNDRVEWAFKAYANLRDEVDKTSEVDCPDYNDWNKEGRKNIGSYSHFKREETVISNINQ